MHPGGKVHGGPHMIDMPVSKQNFFQADILVFDCLQKQFDVSSWIDQGGFARGFTAQQGAILLIRGDWDDG